jgi:hypothetical protein
VGAVSWERWTRAAGAVVVVLVVAAFIVAGEQPTVGDSTEGLISYYDGGRGKVLVSGLLFALASGFFIWFAAAIANLLREGGERPCRRDGDCSRHGACDSPAGTDWNGSRPCVFRRGWG